MPPALVKSFSTVTRENAFLTGKTLEQASQNATLSAELDECKDYLTQLNAERALLTRDRQEQEAHLVQLREELASARTMAQQDELTIERLRQEVDSLQNERQRQEHATREQAREAAQARDATAGMSPCRQTPFHHQISPMCNSHALCRPVSEQSRRATRASCARRCRPHR